ncbi:MAG: GlxA family transcriptional regulator [Alphaproteobacteria bacterium]|nr:GlxA family transcriptional regulator [Alphaproteobacteria bacterium]
MSPYHIAFCVVPDFALASLAIGVDVLRVANRMGGRPLFRWTILSRDGQPARASSGITIMVDGALPAVQATGADGLRPDLALVVAAFDVERYCFPELKRWLTRQRAAGRAVGGIASGAYVLAEAGLLGGRRCTIHWENIPAFAERFPDVRVASQLCVIDDDICTCAGSTSVMDMMLQIVTRQTDARLAAKVAEQCLVSNIRQPEDSQRVPIGPERRVAHPVVAAAFRIMDNHIEEPLPLDRIAREVGLSLRQLERLFAAELGRSPAASYRDLRLERAKHLLSQTAMPALEVGLACGFASAAHFSRAYRQCFGHPPSQTRQRRAGGSRSSASHGLKQ